MKKVVATGIFTFLILFAFTQDVKTIKKSVDKSDWATAKTQIDAFLVKNPGNPEGLWYKARIYSAIAGSEQLKASVPDARKQAFDAFKTAQEKGEKSNKDYQLLMVTSGQGFYKPVFELYTGYYDDGATKFNTAAGSGNKDDFKKAYDEFVNANNVGAYIFKNKWALSEIDTSLLLNIGKAALNAGMKDEAIQTFKKIADANIHFTAQGSAGFDLPYQWLTLYYKQQKDEANLIKYSSLGKQFFPADDYFDAVLLDYYHETKNKDALFKQYDAVVSKFPDSANYRFNYANELFNYVYNADEGAKIPNKEALLQTINVQLTKALSIKPEDVNTNWLFAQYYFNQGIDRRELARDIKSTKPEDVKKKNDILSSAIESFNKAIPYAEKGMAALEVGTKKADKSRYKSIVNLLNEISKALQKPDKVKIYEAKYDAADALFVK